jgi:UDP-N-acetyl-D-mannosaminuronic acid dehydrogenase
LLRERAEVVLHDPYVKEYEKQKIEKDVYEAVKDADILFIATNHNIYKKLDIKKIKSLVKKNCIVCDVWNVLGTGKIVYRINNVNEEIAII